MKLREGGSLAERAVRAEKHHLLPPTARLAGAEDRQIHPLIPTPPSPRLHPDMPNSAQPTPSQEKS